MDHHEHEHEHAHAGRGHAGHDHGPPPRGGGRAFAIASTLNLAYVVVEVAFGLIAHSTALLADAAHNMGDVLGLLMAWGAAALATRAPSSKRTYGFRSMTMLAALANALLILFAAGGVGWEAISRARSTAAVEGGTVAMVAIIGVGINVVSALLFARGRGRDVNMRAAFVHLMADAAVGVGVAIAGVLVMWTGKVWIDPIASLVVTLVILVSTVQLLRETFNLALAGVPAHIDLEKVRAYLAALPTVCEVHDLHVWPMSTTEVALTVHLRVPWPDAAPAFMNLLAHDLEHAFGIHHVTIQLEALGALRCSQAAATAV